MVLSWEDNAGSRANYLLERRVDPAAAGPARHLSPNSQSYNDTGVGHRQTLRLPRQPKNNFGTS